MEKNTLFKKNYTIQLRDVDFKKNLKLSSLFHYLQDVALLAVDDLGIGIETLEEKYDVTWILIRMRVEIVRNPKWNDEITIETWPQEPKSVEFARDFIVKDENDNIIIKAISSWVIMDINKRRIRKSAVIAIDYPPIIKNRALDCVLGKISKFDKLEFAFEKFIGYNDIDFNKHLNNTRYIDLIMECFSIHNHTKYNLESFEINYINEIMHEDTIMIYKDSSNINSNRLYLEGISKNTQKLVFRTLAEVKVNNYN